MQKILTILENIISPDFKNHLEFLDGYRGCMAILVVLDHINQFYHGQKDYGLFIGYGYYIGIIGYFELSAFLLTYRLLKDFDEANSMQNILLKLKEYVIRRFFRIYLTFQVFWILSRVYSFKAFGSSSINVPYINGVFLLEPLGLGHLWSVIVEIKYYFLILPFLTLFASKCGRFWLISVFSIIILIYKIEIGYNEQKLWQDTYSLTPYLPIFLFGSLLAIIYFNLKKSSKISEYIDNWKFKAVLTFILFVVLILQLLYVTYLSVITRNDNSKVSDNNLNKHILELTFTTAHLSFIILLLLIFSEPNILTMNLFGNKIFTTCGKYSFGIYLFHFEVMNYLKLIMDKFNYKSETHLIYIPIVFLFTYLHGFVWFYVIEDTFIKTANYLCKRINSEQGEGNSTLAYLCDKISFYKDYFNRNKK